MNDNPSADKFGPPPEQAQRERERLKGARAGGALGTTSLIVAVAALRILSHSRRGWIAILAGVLTMIGYGVQFALSHRRQDDNPYSPPSNITR